MISEKQSTLNELRRIPSIGKACAYDLWKIGIKKTDDLKYRNPKELYERLNELTGTRHDICMLYTFRCAVYFASTKKPSPEKLKWWYWKDKKYHEEATVSPRSLLSLAVGMIIINRQELT